MKMFNLKVTCSIVIVGMILSSIALVAGTSSSINGGDGYIIEGLTDPFPILSSPPEDDLPAAWSDIGDFVISFGEDAPVTPDAEMPDIAVAPPGSPWAGSIHTVWMELNNAPADIPFSEIHYSMSEAEQHGLEWSNDEASENDTILSDSAEATGIQNDALYPSIAIDPQGIVHVVWAQTYADFTYEIHYSSSIDNGKTWSGYDGNSETLVSYRHPIENSWWIDTPCIAISTNPITLHVTWSELGTGDGVTRTMYSRSTDQGSSWSGALGGDVVISDPASQDSANLAEVAVGGVDGELVHVVWTQDIELSPGIWTSSVFYARSMDFGDSWEPVRIISQSQPLVFAQRARIDAYNDNVHVIWAQFDSTSGEPAELLYSGSQDKGDFWSGEVGDTVISFPDGNEVLEIALAVLPDTGGQGVHAIWAEVDESSPLGSCEIHESINTLASGPSGWSGLDQDNVISFPDPEALADAHSPAIEVGRIAGEWRSQIVWQEKDVRSLINAEPDPGKTTFNLGDHNTEIHYIPATTFDASPLSIGWNFISSPLVQDNTSILMVLDDSWGDNSTTWDLVLWYDPSGSSNHWRSYNKNYAGTQDLTTMDHEKGIWIKITSLGDGNLTFAGDHPTSTNISLKAGWNLIGYPARNDSAYNVSQLKAAVTGSIVEGYDPGGAYKLKTLADSYVLKKSEAYWVYVASDTTWTVDW